MPVNGSQRSDSTRRGAAEFLRAYEARQRGTAPEAAPAPRTLLSAAQEQHQLRVAYEMLKNSATYDALSKDEIYLNVVAKSANDQPEHPIVEAHVCRLATAQEARALHSLSDAFTTGRHRYYQGVANHGDGQGYSDSRDESSSSIRRMFASLSRVAK